MNKKELDCLIDISSLLIEKYEIYSDITCQLKYCRQILKEIKKENEITETNYNKLVSAIDYALFHFYNLNATKDLKEYKQHIEDFYYRK